MCMLGSCGGNSMAKRMASHTSRSILNFEGRLGSRPASAPKDEGGRKANTVIARSDTYGCDEDLLQICW